MAIRKLSTLAAACLLALAGVMVGAGSAGATTSPKPYYSHSHCAGYARVGKTSVYQSTCVTSSISTKTVAAREWVRIKNTGKTKVTVTEKCTLELWDRGGGKHRTLKKRSAGNYSTKTVVKPAQVVAVQPTLCQTSVAVPTSKSAYVDYHVNGGNTVHMAGAAKATSASDELGSYSGDGTFTGVAGTDGCPSGYSPTFNRGKDNHYCIGIA